MAFFRASFLIGLLLHITNGSPLGIQDQYLTRIVGGVDAPDNHSPHAMALTSGYLVTTLVCGASIISECHVLTAAHCIEAFFTWTGELSTSLLGVYGSNKWQSTDKRTRFSGFVIHEEYDRYNFKKDIGILYVKGKLSDSHRWGVIPLNFNWIGAGHPSYVTGWGRLSAWGPIPATLQLIYLETISHKSCEAGVAGAVPPGWWVTPVHEDVEICTLHPKGVGFGVCNGDSGSALVSRDTNTQIGIVSWGFPCANGVPDIFVRVSAFKGFLTDAMKSCECNKSEVVVD